MDRKIKMELVKEAIKKSGAYEEYVDSISKKVDDASELNDEEKKIVKRFIASFDEYCDGFMEYCAKTKLIKRGEK